MNTDNIIQALNVYEGTQESLEKTVAVLTQEMGEDWTNQIFQKLGGLSPELKEKLNHVFNYYASLTAWQEAQTYLQQTEPLAPEVISERMPVLQHWLDFFGEQGKNLYHQLEEKINNSTTDIPQDKEESEPVMEENEVSEESLPSTSTDPIKEETQQEVKEEPQTEYDENSEEAFLVKKTLKQVDLLNSLQSWLSARCLELGDIEVFAYPYYGMIVDLMRQSIKAIKSLENLTDKEIVGHFYDGGYEALLRKKQAIEADVQVAVENCESDTTALIDKNVNLDEMKKTLGALDESTENEYLGPAPDGFELMEDETPLDEKAVKEEYQKLENEVREKVGQEDSEKNTSQNEQNNVQRKLSFSLKPKKT